MDADAALIVVDMQKDFMEDGALGVPRASKLIAKINALLPHFPHLLATRDWHPPHHISFASTHGKKVGETIFIHGKSQVLWPDHCIQNQRGSEFAEGLDTSHFEQIFNKGTDPNLESYSIFGDESLAPYLRTHNISHLYFAGVATDYCVLYSTLDALQLGFKVTVLLDCCRAIGDGAAAIQKMGEAGATLA